MNGVTGRDGLPHDEPEASAEPPRHPGSEPGGRPPPRFDAEAPDAAALGRDWVTLWQSEMAGLVVDREVAEGWQVLFGLWSAAAQAALAAMPRPRGPADGSAGRARPAAPPRSPAADDASGGRDAEFARLVERIGELERRLRNLERGAGAHDAGRKGGGPNGGGRDAGHAGTSDADEPSPGRTRPE